MTHNTNPHTGHSGEMPSADVNNHDYDVLNEDVFLDEAADDMRDVFDDMHQTAQHSGQVPHGLPTGAQIAAMAAAQHPAVVAAAAQANAIVVATATVNAHNQNIPAVTGQYSAPPLVAAQQHNAAQIPAHGPLAHADGERCRAMARTVGLTCAFMIPTGVALGSIVVLGLYLGGIIGAAKPTVVKQVLPDMKNPNGPSGPPPTPDEKTLAMWLMMDDAKFFALFREKIATDTVGFNLVNTSYVASSLSAIYDKMFPLATNPDYANNLVPDSQIDSDFSALKSGPNGVTLLGIFDVSASYPDPSMMSQAAIDGYSRGIRLNYLARMYAKTLKEAMAAKAAGTPGTVTPGGTTANVVHAGTPVDLTATETTAAPTTATPYPTGA